MRCKAPTLSFVEGLTMTFPMTAQMGLLMDAVEDLLTVPALLTIHENPRVNQFESVQEFSQATFMLTITVSVSKEREIKGLISLPIFYLCFTTLLLFVLFVN